MRRPFTVLTGLAFITITALAGCGQSQANVVAASTMPAKKVTTNISLTKVTDNNQTTGSNRTQPGNPTPMTVNPSTRSSAQQNSSSLTAVSFATDKIGFVGSTIGILRTLDGGKTWGYVYKSPRSEPILGLQATTETVNGKQYIYVVAWTKDYMLTSVDGRAPSRVHFDGSARPGLGNAPIVDVSLLPNDFIYFVSRGVVWTSDGMGSGWLKRTPLVHVTSVAAVDDSTCYAVTENGLVYKTTDGGLHWNKVLSAPIKNGEQPWKTEIQAHGNHVAVLFYGAGAGMNQEAYILYDSNNAGMTWNSVVDEGYFSILYGGAKILDKTDIGEYAGPFAMDVKGNILITGFSMAGEITVLTTISPAGKTLVHDPVGPSANSPNVFDMLPSGIATPDGKHVFVVGGKNKGGVVEKSDDGGRLFHAE